MQPESESQQFNGGFVNPSAKKVINWKKILLFVLVAILAAALSGAAVWAYMSNQNDSNSKSLNAQITTKTVKITSLQSNVKTLETQVATKTTTGSTSSQQSNVNGKFETLLTFCAKDNKSVGTTDLTNESSTFEKDKYFGSCSVMPANAATGGYVITAMYENNAWTELFEGQAPTAISAAACTKYHVPTVLGTCPQI